jgi:hypothetical protein
VGRLPIGHSLPGCPTKGVDIVDATESGFWRQGRCNLLEIAVDFAERMIHSVNGSTYRCQNEDEEDFHVGIL